MPKENFFNLESEKQKRILEIAYDEFAKHSYETASLSKIVEEVGIAKGTM